MPQLDILTFLIQISLTKFLFWVLLLLFQSLILPHLIYFLKKKLIWNNINKLLINYNRVSFVNLKFNSRISKKKKNT